MENNNSVIPFLSSSSGQRVQDLNKELAVRICRDNNIEFIKEIVENLYNKKRAVQGDCIKVLDEIGLINPTLIAPYSSEILKLLHHPNNRMVWGAMAVLDYICKERTVELFNSLDIIMETLDNASVITRDHGVKILVQLAKTDSYYNFVWPLYIEQLESCPANQFPSYAEWGAEVVHNKDYQSFKTIIENKLKEIDQTSKIVRLNKVLKSLVKKFKTK